MVRKQEKSDLTGLIKWKIQKVTFFFSHPLLYTLHNKHTNLQQQQHELHVLHDI